ncbi:Rmf/CrpP fold protein [Streptomyces sp. BPTC-684]|uniref:Rmf/CrpP fold protein n=1 Tax=Streptomyces sp. BPTC-684 TaxID=3043734 RepID=UPI0024B238C1|nr:Rmf/CrpP fold protein [Streptomyces sp. BPTC-684]WHM36306.1 hypothetical protein QIY60_04750 [Streptomyces sp. BPTC-684]
MGPREQIVEAMLKGREAGKTDDRPVCPYPRDSLLRRAWIKGYADARRTREVEVEVDRAE